MFNFTLRGLVLGGGMSLVVLGACGGAAMPQSELTQAKSALSAAEARNSASHPEAALHVKMAKDQIEEAEQLIADDQHPAARLALVRAQKDAELALELSREAESREAADQALAKVRQLQNQATAEE